PGVSGSYMLTKGEFGAPGSRRLNCLSDGTSLVEQVLESERNSSTFRFRYVVWNYTTEKARPIEYGVGNFLYSDIGGGRTHVTWTYSFQLNRHRFPGYLGALGAFLFRVRFLDSEFADLMRDVLGGIKSDAEQLPNTSVPAAHKQLPGDTEANYVIDQSAVLGPNFPVSRQSGTYSVNVRTIF